MDKKIKELQKVYQEVEDTLQTSVGNPIYVQTKIQNIFLKLENSKRDFLKYILSEKDKSSSKHGISSLILDLYTKYPSYLDDAFLIKLEHNNIIDTYSQEYNTSNLAEQLYTIFDNKDKKDIMNTNKKDDSKFEVPTFKEITDFNEKTNVIFPLTPMQKILRNLMNSETPYKGMLFIHGTGVGKTCTAIQIAENLKDFVTKMKTKIYVIRFDEFKRQIFENNKLRKGEIPNLQCTGDTYIKEVSNTTTLRDSIIECKGGDESQCIKVEKAINKQINKYYEGYNTPYQWANDIQKLIKSKTRNLSGLEKHQKIIKIIRSKFNNSVLIIDEAHNLRNISKDTVKKRTTVEELNSIIDTDINDTSEEESVNFITIIINSVLLYSQNMRLLLLSATPMYDKPTDIIPLLNFLRMNDKLPNIKKNQIFDKDNNLLDSGKKILRTYSTGYISYVRGNDPIEFPIRLEADTNIPNKILDLKEYPDVDILGKKIAKKDRIKYMKLVKCPLNITHQNALLSIIGIIEDNDKNEEKGSVKEDFTKEDFNLENQGIVEKNFSVAYNTEIQMSNFMYQTLKESRNQPRFCYGERGFNSICKKIPKKYSFKFEDEDMGKRFLPDGLKKHGPKLYECVQNIEKSNGPIFIYTYYTFGGVLPMAFALEMLGYTRYGGIEPLLQNKHKKTQKKGEYIIYTGDSQLSKGATKYFNLRKKMIDNKNVKVVIASKKGSEGLNLFGFREIHLLDPWHNINLLEQTIGRVIRRRSHHSLPPEKRNVVVYMYSTVMSGDKKHMESIDLRVYRICEKKALLSMEVLNILKKNAIDCQVTKAINYRDKKDYNKDIICLTSHNKEINYNPADNDANKLYSVENYTCFVEEDKKKLSKSKLDKIIQDVEKQNTLLDKTLINYDIEIKDIITIFKNLLIKNYNLYRQDSISIITELLPEKKKLNIELITNIYDIVVNNLENEILQLTINIRNKFIFGKVINVKLSNGDEILRISPYYNQNPDISIYEQHYDYLKFLVTKNIEVYSKLVRTTTHISSKNPYVFKPVNEINLEELIIDLDKIKSKLTKSQNLNYKNIILSLQNKIDNILFKKKISNNIIDVNKDSLKSDSKSKLLEHFLDNNIETSLDLNNNYGFNELCKYLFDKLLINEKIFLLQNLIYRIKNKDKLIFTEVILLNVIQFNFVNKNEFIISMSDTNKKIKLQYYQNYVRNPANLYGFIVADFNKLYLYKFDEEMLTSKLNTKLNNLDIKQFFKNDKIKLKSLITRRWKFMSKQELNNIYCHNAYPKSIYLKPSFKITDYAGKGYKKSVKGVRCSSNKLGQIISYIYKLEPKFKIDIVKNRRKICNDLELLSRIKNNEENPNLTEPGNVIYFLSPEEHYIWTYFQQ